MNEIYFFSLAASKRKPPNYNQRSVAKLKFKCYQIIIIKKQLR